MPYHMGPRIFCFLSFFLSLSRGLQFFPSAYLNQSRRRGSANVRGLSTLVAIGVTAISPSTEKHLPETVEDDNMSLSHPPRYIIFSSSPHVRITTRSNFCFAFAAITSSRNLRLSAQAILLSRVTTSTWSHLEILRDSGAHASPLRSYQSTSSASSIKDFNSDGFDFGSFLAFAELLSVLSSAVIAVVLAVNYAVSGEIGKRVLAWGFVGLVGAVASGSWLRRQQWRRICRGTEEDDMSNLIGRLEKLEEDVRTSATIVRVLSRQLEKLGIRFRITRKSLKEPISETAALAQKNSEAARVLAAQQDILEKELGEIQKVLFAMQEQQRKQLELILAVVKNGKLLDSSIKESFNEHR